MARANKRILGLFLHFTVLALVAALGACSTVNPQNQPFDRKAVQDPDPVPRTGQSNDQRFLLGIALSGGGSRAANFAGGVLEALDEMGVLQSATVISSVSGGSLTSAYFVAHRDAWVAPPTNYDFWRAAQTALSANFRTEWLTHFLRPDNFLSSTFGSHNRTYQLADILEEELFKKPSSHLTFGELPRGGPQLLLNATAMNAPTFENKGLCANRGFLVASMKYQQVSFTQPFFEFCLGSRLDTFRVALAVAASAAFPGVFDPVTLSAYSYGTDQRSGYVHVIDGGASENLGVEAIVAPLVSDLQVALANYHVPTPARQRCLLILGDAAASRPFDSMHEEDDVRGVIDRVVDTDFFDAIDALAARRRFDTLQRIGLSPGNSADQWRFVDLQNMPIKGTATQFVEQSHFVDELKPSEILGERLVYKDLRQVTQDAEPRCAIWHISIESLRDLSVRKWRFSSLRKDANRGHASAVEIDSSLLQTVAEPESKELRALWEISSRVRTDFDLTGPKCSHDQISDAVWRSGYLAALADEDARTSVCKWLTDTGLPVSSNCVSAPPKPGRPISLKYRPMGDRLNYDIECTE